MKKPEENIELTGETTENSEEIYTKKENIELVGEIIEDSKEIHPDDIKDLMPKEEKSEIIINQENTQDVLISDEKYLSVMNNILNEIRDDRKQVDNYIDNFAEMVMNDGDATTSSKEALVNLVKIKTDLQDKMLKAADLMTRIKLKNPYAYSGPHLNALQQNININSENELNKKELIKAINQAKKRKKQWDTHH